MDSKIVRLWYSTEKTVFLKTTAHKDQSMLTIALKFASSKFPNFTIETSITGKSTFKLQLTGGDDRTSKLYLHIRPILPSDEIRPNATLESQQKKDLLTHNGQCSSFLDGFGARKVTRRNSLSHIDEYFEVEMAITSHHNYKLDVPWHTQVGEICSLIRQHLFENDETGTVFDLEFPDEASYISSTLLRKIKPTTKGLIWVSVKSEVRERMNVADLMSSGQSTPLSAAPQVAGPARQKRALGVINAKGLCKKLKISCARIPLKLIVMDRIGILLLPNWWSYVAKKGVLWSYEPQLVKTQYSRSDIRKRIRERVGPVHQLRVETGPDPIGSTRCLHHLSAAQMAHIAGIRANIATRFNRMAISGYEARHWSLKQFLKGAAKN